MRPFLLRLSLFLGINLGILALVLTWGLGPAADQDYLTALVDKRHRLETLAPPRLVILGGSGIAFGIDSGLLETGLGRPTVNMGTNAGLSLELVLGQAEGLLRPGDEVLLIPEYELLLGEHIEGGTILRALMLFPGDARFLDRSLVKVVLDSAHLTLGDRLRVALRNLLAMGRSTSSSYRRDCFEVHGDYTCHLDEPSRPFPDSSDLVVRQDSLDKACKILEAFVGRCTRQRIRVLYSYPAWPLPYLERNRDSLARVAAAVAGIPGLVVLDSPETHGVPLGACYDTPYHLGRAARDRRSRRLLEDLRAAGGSQLP